MVALQCEPLPGVAGTPRISWQSRAYSSAGSASVCVCRTWSTLASTICRRLKRPWGEVRSQPQAWKAPPRPPKVLIYLSTYGRSSTALPALAWRDLMSFSRRS